MSFINPIASASTSRQMANLRVARLYRSCLKALPEMVEMYGMTNVTIPGMRKTVRDSFRSYGSVKDYKVTDLLRHRGEQELREFVLAWKSPMHACGFFTPQESALIEVKQQGDSQFLHDFFKGKK